MTQQFCPRCRRIHFGTHDCLKHKTLPKGIRTMPMADCQPVAPRDAWESVARKTCLHCPNWGTVAGSSGCRLIPAATAGKHQPCDIGYFQRKGRQCFDDPPRYGPRPDETDKRRRAVLDIDPVVPDCFADVAIVTTHFNPTAARRLAGTFAEWKQSLGRLADRLICYEAVFGGAEPEIPGSIVCRGDIMWQKEALLNRALQDCRSKYYCWIDHDLCLSSRTWLVDALAKLDAGEAKAVQLFDRITYLNPQYEGTKSKLGRVAGGESAPGGAWIAETQYLRDVGGFYDRSVVGSGDEWFYAAATNHRMHILARIGNRLSRPMAADVSRYVDQARGRPEYAGNIACEALHLYHGEHENRQYHTREFILKRHGFHQNRDVRVNADGILSWASDKPAMHAEVWQFFIDRRDDG